MLTISKYLNGGSPMSCRFCIFGRGARRKPLPRIVRPMPERDAQEMKFLEGLIAQQGMLLAVLRRRLAD